MLLERKVSLCLIISSYKGFFLPFPPNWKLPFKDEENTNNRFDETVSDDDVQDITRMTSTSILIPLWSNESRFLQLPNLSLTPYIIFLVSQTGKIFVTHQVKSLLTPTRMRVFQYKIINRILYTNKTLEIK